MNGTRVSFTDFINKISKKSNEITSQLVICPPFTAFPDNLKLGANISIGAQNCHHKKSGSYTGEISPEMLKELGCKYVILGHSERNNETNSEIKLKAEIALEVGLHPIVCVGETLKDYNNKKTKQVIEDQCKSRLPTHGKYIVAYEPIWSIGTGCIPTNNSIFEIIETIKLFTDKKNVIYGGSVNLENIDNLLNIFTLSGVLIGSASLNFDHFYAIVEKVEKFL